MMRFAGSKLPGSGGGVTTGHTGVGLPSSARAPADVAPSATVVGFGRFVLDFFGAADGFDCAVGVAGLGATFDVSCAPDVAAVESREMSSAKMRREVVRVVNTKNRTEEWRAGMFSKI